MEPDIYDELKVRGVVLRDLGLAAKQRHDPHHSRA
jgi:hypothetical protein